MTFKLDLYTGKRYTVANVAELNLNRKYEQFAEETWIEQPGKKGKFRFKPFGGLKPSGLWYAYGRTWIDFCPSLKSLPVEHLPPVLELDVDTKNFIKIDNIKQIEIFNNTFKADRGKGHIDWKMVARVYDGIDISLFNPSKSSLSWYQSFDLSSGCIWNLKAIKNVQRIQIRRETPNIFDPAFSMF